MVDIINWENASTTAADNLAVAGISDAEGWLPSTVNNFTRASWAVLAKFWDEYGGVVTVAGTADAITITTTGTHTALSTGLRFIFKAGADNTTAVTLNLDAIGAKAIRKISGGTDVALVAGDLKSGRRYDVVYDAAANSAAGAWIMVTANGDYMPGGTDVAIADGGHGQSTAYAGLDALTVKGSDIASATTTDIGASTGVFIHITGTTTITGLGTKAAGVVRFVTFDGALTLTYNATSLILPGAANITTAAGDTAIFESEGSGNWRCLTYVRAANVPGQTTGTWTPADGSGAALSFTLTGTQSWTRTGREVRANFDVTYPSTADTSAAIISGLPFTSAAGTFGGMVVAFHTNTAGIPVGRVNKSATNISIVNSIGTAIMNDELSGDRIAGYVTYHV